METNAKVALVTGAGRESGIGYGVVQTLAQMSFEVIATARDQEKTKALARKITTKGNSILAEPLDVTDDESVSSLVAFVRNHFGRLDVLINNAGGGLDYGVHPLETDLDFARSALETNLFGAWRMVQQFYPLLKKSNQSRIVNVSSGAGSFGDPDFGLGVHPAVMTSYGISKLALNGLTVKLARQLKDDGILINAVDPGLTATAPGMEDMGARPVSESVDGIVWAATLPDDGPRGGFFRDKQTLSW